MNRFGSVPAWSADNAMPVRTVVVYNHQKVRI